MHPTVTKINRVLETFQRVNIIQLSEFLKPEFSTCLWMARKKKSNTELDEIP
jgi:hypothetical protein